MRRSILAIILFLSALSPVVVHSQTRNAGPVDSVQVYFRVNQATLDPQYMSNGERLSEFATTFRRLTEHDGGFDVNRIRVTAAASPEGSGHLNAQLVQQRLASISSFIQQEYGFVSSLFEFRDQLYDWDLLARLLEQSDEPYRAEVLGILRSGKDDAGITADLRTLDKGRVWMDLLTNYFPSMRYSHVTISGLYGELKAKRLVYQPWESIRIPLPAMTLIAPEGSLNPVPLTRHGSWERDLYFKINGAVLPLLIMNVAVEVDLSNRFSLHVPVYFCPSDWFSRTAKFRCLGTQPELRYWFHPEDGWFVGAHAGMSLYNLAVSNGDYRMQDHDGTTPLAGGGLSVGWRTQLGRNPLSPWRLEIAAGAGVYDLRYDLFDNITNGKLMHSNLQKTYVGPDNVSISIAYRFNLKKHYTLDCIAR